MFVETERLIIRDLTVEDASDLFSIYQNEEVMKFQGGVPSSFNSEKLAINNHIENYYKKNGFGLWAIVSKKDKTVIGRGGLLLTEIKGKQEVEISYLIGQNNWGMGLATEAVSAILKYSFDILKIERVFACIEPLNHPSIKVAEKIGMNYIGDSIYKGKKVQLFLCSTNGGVS